MDGASRRVWCSRRVRDGRWSKYPGGGVLTGPPCDSLRRALRPAKWRFARNSQREKEFERSRFCPWSISALGATYVVVLPPSDKAVEMAQACLASPALGGAGLRPPPAVGRRRGSGAAVGSRARCARQPGARRAPAPSHSSEKNVHHPRGIWVSCGAARDPGDGDDEDGPSTSEPRMAPPTPSPVFSRRPMSARQRKVLNERVLARPPPRARGRKRRGAGIWPVAAGVAAAG